MLIWSLFFLQLELLERRRDLIVVGAGVIGMEYACMINVVPGTTVTVVDPRPDVLSFADNDVIENLQYTMRQNGARENNFELSHKQRHQWTNEHRMHTWLFFSQSFTKYSSMYICPCTSVLLMHQYRYACTCCGRSLSQRLIGDGKNHTVGSQHWNCLCHVLLFSSQFTYDLNLLRSKEIAYMPYTHVWLPGHCLCLRTCTPCIRIRRMQMRFKAFRALKHVKSFCN